MNPFKIVSIIVELRTGVTDVLCSSADAHYMATDGIVALIRPFEGLADAAMMNGIKERSRRAVTSATVLGMIQTVKGWQPFDASIVADVPKIKAHGSECEACDGTGTAVCDHCDSEIDCDECDGAGGDWCTNWYADKDDDNARIVELDGVSFDASYIAMLIRLAPKGIYEYGLADNGMLGLRTSEWTALLMPIDAGKDQ